MADINDKTKLTPEQEQAKREEDAAVERARKDLEERKSKIGLPVVMGQLSWLNTEEGRTLLGKTLGKMPGSMNKEFPDGKDYPCPEGTSTVIVPRPFRLMLDHHHVFDVPQGVVEMPTALVGHHSTVNHGVQAYARSAPMRPVVVAATTGRLPGDVTAGGRTLPQQNYANAAQALSGLTVEDWNKLTDEDRARAISMEIAKADAAIVLLRPPGVPDPAKQQPALDPNVPPQPDLRVVPPAGELDTFGQRLPPKVDPVQPEQVNPSAMGRRPSPNDPPVKPGQPTGLQGYSKK